MKFNAEVGDDIYEVEALRDGDCVNAVIDGDSIVAEVSEPEPNAFLIKHDGRIFEAFVVQEKRSGETVTVSVNGSEFAIKLVDPKQLRTSSKETDHAGGLAEIRTAMPGKVVRVLFAAGKQVEKGEGVLVVEAMKMQNELKSPKNGVVKEIRVQEGDAVSAGDVLAIIE